MLPHSLPQQIAPENTKSSYGQDSSERARSQPGDFDAELDRPKVDMHEDHRHQLSILITVKGDEASG
jgi:hypothetical protein